jgi:hypothetical protein
MTEELDYKKISELSTALASYANGLSKSADTCDFTNVRINFGWLKTLFEAVECEVKQ